MDLERVLYKKMTKDELIDKLIAYKNIECHDRAIAHEFLCMQKENPSRMNFVTHRLTDIADPKRVAEEIRRVKAERTASAQQPIKDELTDTIPVYVTLYKNIRFKKRFDVTLDQLERLKEEDSAESKEVPITLLDETLNLMDATLDIMRLMQKMSEDGLLVMASPTGEEMYVRSLNKTELKKWIRSHMMLIEQYRFLWSNRKG